MRIRTTASGPSSQVVLESCNGVEPGLPQSGQISSSPSWNTHLSSAPFECLDFDHNEAGSDDTLTYMERQHGGVAESHESDGGELTVSEHIASINGQDPFSLNNAHSIGANLHVLDATTPEDDRQGSAFEIWGFEQGGSDERQVIASRLVGDAALTRVPYEGPSAEEPTTTPYLLFPPTQPLAAEVSPFSFTRHTSSSYPIQSPEIPGAHAFSTTLDHAAVFGPRLCPSTSVFKPEQTNTRTRTRKRTRDDSHALCPTSDIATGGKKARTAKPSRARDTSASVVATQPECDENPPEPGPSRLGPTRPHENGKDEATKATGKPPRFRRTQEAKEKDTVKGLQTVACPAMGCDLVWDPYDYYAVKAHVEKHFGPAKSSDGSLQCLWGCEKGQSRARMQHHIGKEHIGLPYPCPLKCGSAWGRSGYQAMHMKRAHGKTYLQWQSQVTTP
ncbi:hypothetical protein C8Q77DRAFT_1208367 [Trametes polyzona]|nr:hypothetical protein C8Q77DRAFT_1208367 [Trametes polyzona]